LEKNVCKKKKLSTTCKNVNIIMIIGLADIY